MKKLRKLTDLTILSNHIQKYRIMMIVFALIIAAFALFNCIYWHFDENSTGSSTLDNLYLVSHIFFTVNSISIIVVLVLDKFKLIKPEIIPFITHAYSFLLIGWSTVLCIIDLQLGYSPMIYILASTVVAGLFITEPIFFSISTGISFVTILVFSIVLGASYFTQGENVPLEMVVENIFNFAVYAILICIISFKSYRITMKEYRAMDRLHQLTYYDELTGLLNERSYMDAIDHIAKEIENDHLEKLAIVMMDVNNLKATNDAYGHRYGCHLVVKCGHDLPSIFPSSKLFHVGGDEFIAIVVGDDYDHFEERIASFDETMTYTKEPYEGQVLIFSVARGYTKYQKGDRYQDVLQRADAAMYENKKMLKEKYNFKGR